MESKSKYLWATISYLWATISALGFELEYEGVTPTAKSVCLVQDLIWLLQRLGGDLGFRFERDNGSPHEDGKPWSAALTSVIHWQSKVSSPARVPDDLLPSIQLLAAMIDREAWRDPSEWISILVITDWARFNDRPMNEVDRILEKYYLPDFRAEAEAALDAARINERALLREISGNGEPAERISWEPPKHEFGGIYIWNGSSEIT